MYGFTCFSPVTRLTRNRLTQPNMFDTPSSTGSDGVAAAVQNQKKKVLFYFIIIIVSLLFYCFFIVF